MRTATFLLAFIALPCAAGQVYKCKGPKGEVTFTNIKCPESTEASQYGTYQKAADSPDQLREAIEDGEERRARQAAANDQAALDRAARAEERAHAADAAAIVNEDTRSQLGLAARNARIHDEAAKGDRDYWAGSRLGASRDAAAETEDQPELPDPFAEQQKRDEEAKQRHEAAFITSCSRNGSNVECRKSDGSETRGVLSPYGNATLHDSAGSIKTDRISRDPFGNLNVDGTCVRDVATGSCK